MIDDADHRAILEGLTAQHRRELGELRALCVTYRALLEDAGVDCPDDSHAAEALRRYRRLFEVAGYDDPEQHRELTAPWWGAWPRDRAELPGGPWAAARR